MAKRKVLRYPLLRRPDTLGLELALSYPDEIEAGLERLQDSLDHPESVKQGLTAVEFLIRDFEKYACRLLESEGEDTEYSHILYDEDHLDGVRISSAKAVIIHAQNLRDAIEEKNLDEALIRMMLMTASAIRMEIFEDAMWGLHSEQHMSKGGLASGAIRREKAAVGHHRIAVEAKKLLRDGVPRHELCSRLAKRYPLTPRRIRDVLKARGIYKKKRKPT